MIWKKRRTGYWIRIIFSESTFSMFSIPKNSAFRYRSFIMVKGGRQLEEGATNIFEVLRREEQNFWGYDYGKHKFSDH